MNKYEKALDKAVHLLDDYNEIKINSLVCNKECKYYEKCHNYDGDCMLVCNGEYAKELKRRLLGENEAEKQWAIIYDDGDGFIQCCGVYEDIYEALGHLMIDFEDDMDEKREDGYDEVNILILGELTECQTGYAYRYEAINKEPSFKKVCTYYLLEANQND